MTNQKLIFHSFLGLLLSLFMTVCGTSAQDIPSMDASALRCGQAFGLNVQIASDTGIAFDQAQGAIQAELCPVDAPEACQSMNVDIPAESKAIQTVRLSVPTLPTPGNYRLTIVYNDTAGIFDSETIEYLLTDVQPESPTSESVEIAEPIPVVLTPLFTSTDGIIKYFGEQLQTASSYQLNLTTDIPLDDSVLVEITLPEQFNPDNLMDGSSCSDYFTADGRMIISGSEFSEENGNHFSCGFIFGQALNLYNQIMHITLIPADSETAYTMTPLDWYNFPTIVIKPALSHQLTLSDSRGNQLCSDIVPCQLLNADDVFTLTYHYPSDWVESPLASAPEEALGTPVLTFPPQWSEAINRANEDGLLDNLDNPCLLNTDGSIFLLPEYVAGTERYKVSCQFAVAGLNEGSGTISLHNENPYYQLSDLNLQLPSGLQKAQVTLSPSLTLRMTDSEEASEQIFGNAVNRLYRAVNDYGDTAVYTLHGTVSGVSAVRAPQAGDGIHVNWNLITQLESIGALPDCLHSAGNGDYILGELTQTENGWESSCSFSFPKTFPTGAISENLTMSLQSSLYQNTSYVSFAYQPFVKEKLYVDLEVPQRFFLSFPQQIRAHVHGVDGNLSDYQRMILAENPIYLNSDWFYNSYGDCLGTYEFDEEGYASCNYFFDQGAAPSSLHFYLNSVENELADIIFNSAVDYSLNAIAPISAKLSAELYHSGTAETLPATDDAAFTVMDAYQLRFRLIPDPGYETVLSTLETDNEGHINNWGYPLTLNWSILPYGSETLSFVRDGSQFTASYDFHFEQGDITLDDYQRQIYLSANIPGWEVEVPESVHLPGRIDKQTVRLTIGDFSKGEPLTGQDNSFDVNFEGNWNGFDSFAMQIGIESEGYRTPLNCYPLSDGIISCDYQPVCAEYSEYGTAEKCTDEMMIYAEYAGDGVNQAAIADTKPFSVKRARVDFSIPKNFNLSKDDIQSVQAASEDMTYFGYGSIKAGTRSFDSYLIARESTWTGWEYQSYPFTFNYSVNGEKEADPSRFFLDVTYVTADDEEETISLSPQNVGMDEVNFVLDFGSELLLENGKMVRSALDEAVALRRIEVRYAGDNWIAESKKEFEAKDVHFDLVVVTYLPADLETVDEHTARVTGELGKFSGLDSYTVYCSQLLSPLHCYENESSVEILVDETSGEDISQVETTEDKGCWGVIHTTQTDDPVLHMNEVSIPMCYFTAIHNDEQIWLGRLN